MMLNIWCEIPWWLLWLLPLLVAALIWWYWYNRYKDKVAEYEGKITGFNNRIHGLEEDLAACKRKRSELEGDLAITKGRMREMEATMKNMQADGGSNVDVAASAGLGALTSSLGSSESTSSSSSGTSDMSIYAGIKSDNLQIIEGIGPKMEGVLKENGVSSLAALGAMSEKEIQTILDKYGDKYKIIDPGTWAAQAKLAGDGKFDELIDYQKRLNTGRDNAVRMTDSKLEKFLIKIGALKAFKQDDLKAIEGIGPATDKLLRANGINTWRELADSSVDSIKAILAAAGSRFALSDPTTWPKQAELAADGKFDQLREYQDFLDGGKA